MPLKSKSLIDKRGRECVDCEKYKTWENYHIDRRAKTGHFPRCKKCSSIKNKEFYNKYKTSFKSAKPNNNPPPLPEIDINSPLDLSFLADLGGFTENEIKRLLMTVNVYTKEPHFLKQLQIFNKFFPHRKPGACKQLVAEFTEAYMNGVSFEQEMKTRKYRKDGKKQIGGPK